MLILASKSPTRKTLLANAGLSFSCAHARIDERATQAAISANGGGSADVARALAEAKALVVSAGHRDAVIIGADQTLECGDLDIHKPADRKAAAAQLRSMAGRDHLLHSGVALVRNGAVLWSEVQSARLRLKPFTDTELDHILGLEGDAILSTVGGYRLEGPSVRLFESIKGDYFAILGLPLLPLLAALERLAPQTLVPGDEDTIRP